MHLICLSPMLNKCLTFTCWQLRSAPTTTVCNRSNRTWWTNEFVSPWNIFQRLKFSSSVIVLQSADFYQWKLFIKCIKKKKSYKWGNAHTHTPRTANTRWASDRKPGEINTEAWWVCVCVCQIFTVTSKSYIFFNISYKWLHLWFIKDPAIRAMVPRRLQQETNPEHSSHDQRSSEVLCRYITARREGVMRVTCFHKSSGQRRTGWNALSPTPERSRDETRSAEEVGALAREIASARRLSSHVGMETKPWRGSHM